MDASERQRLAAKFHLLARLSGQFRLYQLENQYPDWFKTTVQ